MEFFFKFIMEKFDMKNILILITVLGAGLLTTQTSKASSVCTRCDPALNCYFFGLVCIWGKDCYIIPCPDSDDI